jgi:signal transduction histidine kinase
LAVGVESVTRTSRALARLSRADEIRLSLDNLVTLLDDAESGMRGYLATGDPAFLQPYERATTTWRDKLVALRRVTDPAQRSDVDDVEVLVGRLVDEMKATLGAHDVGASTATLAEGLRAGTEDATAIRRAAARVENTAESLATTRVAAATNRSHWEAIAFGGVVFSFALGSAAFAFQRRREEERRRQAEERAALVDVTDEFIGVLGHDLRNPIGAILMAARLLMVRKHEAKDAMLVQRIISSTERVLRMIDSLLDLARSRLGPGIPVAPTPSDLRDVVSNVVDEIRTRYPNRRVAWDWRGAGIGRWDYDRMAQVVSNLIGNAIEHGDPTRPVTVHLDGVGRAIELTVHNFGDAIRPDALPTLFGSYKRPASSSQHHGLGLGLFIADQIVRAHGGTLTVTSTATEGTAFKARFDGSLRAHANRAITSDR